jgi:LysM repeat protein
MLRLLVGLALLVQASPVPPRSDARAALAPLFDRALRDPAGVVPLIVEASAALDDVEPGEARLLADTLEPFCRRAFFGPERLPSMEKLGLRVHTVKKGEVPERIAARYRIDAGLLARLNEGFDARRLREGQELKVLDLSDRSLEIVVQKSRWRLAAWRSLPAEARAQSTQAREASAGAARTGGAARVLVMSAPVGLGAPDSPTPVGTTSIVLRALDPDWTEPGTGKVYKAGDPRNVLGGYWIALDAKGIGRNGIGLHGFTGAAPANWIEQPASHGCVRMLQSDIDRVYRIALEGTPVTLAP